MPSILGTLERVNTNVERQNAPTTMFWGTVLELYLQLFSGDHEGSNDDLQNSILGLMKDRDQSNDDPQKYHPSVLTNLHQQFTTGSTGWCFGTCHFSIYPRMRSHFHLLIKFTPTCLWGGEMHPNPLRAAWFVKIHSAIGTTATISTWTWDFRVVPSARLLVGCTLAAMLRNQHEK